MTAGRADIGRTTFGVLTDLVAGDIGTVPQYLHFYPDGGGDSVYLDHTRPAYRCRGCEAVVLAGTQAKPAGRKKRQPEPRQEEAAEPGPAACPACGAAVAPGQARCPGCDIALR
jgi:hypothetical protein